MKQYTKKRQAQNRAYNKAKRERAEELKAMGEWVCFFTGEPLPDDVDPVNIPVHHLNSRTEDNLVDKKFFAFYKHGECHTAIHEMPIAKLKRQWWWKTYMRNLKELDGDLYYHWQLREENN